MTDLQQKFAEGQRALQKGEHARAAGIFARLRQGHPEQPAVFHLLGRALKGQGKTEEAREAFVAGIARHPNVAALHAELASLLDDLGEGEASVAAYDRAIALEPALLDARIDRALARHRHLDAMEGYRELQALVEDYPNSARIHLNIGLIARKLGLLDESAAAAARAQEAAPGHFKALRLDAQLAMDRGRPAVELFRKARQVDPADKTAIAGEAAAFLAEGDTESASGLLRSILADEPGWNEGQRLLAQIRWQSGDGEDFTRGYREALALEPGNRPLWCDYAIATARALGHERALPIFAEARHAVGDDPYLDNLEANSLCELGELDRAEAIYETLREIDDPAYRLPLVRYYIKSRNFEAARDYGLALVDQAQGPDAWPYVSIAWRMLEDPQWLWLEGERDFPGVFDLEDLLPELPALAERLRALHRWQTHPFDQSLRGGTQTDGVLFGRDEPEIRSLVGHVRKAVARYIAALPPIDASHPVLARRRGDFHFTGSWSVRLTDSGFHVNHIHNQGWISSALYVALPESLGEGEDRQAGWLALGEPPAEFGLDLPPLKLVEPRPGRLALFPSIMWHGTRPFPAGERMTVAFDVAPN